MLKVKKVVIVEHTPRQMFELVNDIDSYPSFLPWCSHTEIKSKTAHDLVGALHVNYMKIKTGFTTHNHNTPYSKITIKLVEGPFKSLSGHWHFTPLGEAGCKIEFTLHYQFSNSLIEKVIGPVFNYISQNLINSFIKEANKRYGRTN